MLERLVKEAKALNLGPGLEKGTQVGPIINERQMKRVLDYIQTGKKEGARLLCGGRQAQGPDAARGWFVEPTIFADVKRSMRIFQEEIFGPVLSVMKAKDRAEAIDALNDSAYGLSSSIYTRDINSALGAVPQIEAGIVYVNGLTIGAEVHLPFGGTKASGNGTGKPAKRGSIFLRNGKRSTLTTAANCSARKSTTHEACREERHKALRILHPAPPDYKWPRCPEADRFIEETQQSFLARHAFARRLSERMRTETSTLFSAWVDHLILPARKETASRLEALGFCEDKKAKRPAGTLVFYHPFADLPEVLLSKRAKETCCAIVVEDLWRFELAQRLSLPIEGAPYSSYRFIRLPEGPAEFLIIERRGTSNFAADKRGKGQAYLACFEKWIARPRRFASIAEGMKQTLRLARAIAGTLGTGAAATLFLESERIYWQSRNQAAQIQKARQDALGLGWANHDHHTFRSSRAHFPMLIQILLAFGFKKRERYYAGNEAGWGAQIMEQPEAGSVIFADVDLAPEDVAVDFTRHALEDLPRPNTVGLWCALHGESILKPECTIWKPSSTSTS